MSQRQHPERFRLIAAVHLFLIREGQVLLLRRANTGYEDGNYSVVAGHLDGGETVIAAAIRETQEEIGVTLTPASLRVAGVMHRASEPGPDNERVDFFVEATAWEGAPVNGEPGKCDELRWATLDRLPPNMVPYVRRALATHHAQMQAGDQPWSVVWFDSFGWPSAGQGSLAGTAGDTGRSPRTAHGTMPG